MDDSDGGTCYFKRVGQDDCCCELENVLEERRKLPGATTKASTSTARHRRRLHSALIAIFKPSTTGSNEHKRHSVDSTIPIINAPRMSFFTSPTRVYLTAAAMRLVFLVYGAWQDAHSAMKYTDIDYNVFTDAARYVSRGASPYARDTYRYTPLLAWMLLPTTWKGVWWFSFGKILFSLADILAGALVVKVLVNPGSGSSSRTGMSSGRALRYASLWLLNPMVANISTRGSSEALLAVLISALLWAVLNRKITLAGFLLGFGVHFKIYPFIYGLSILWWLDESSPRTKDNSGNRNSDGERSSSGVIGTISSFFTPDRVHLTLTSLSIFSALNVSMYILYGVPFVQHTYLHHLSRIDHRHNFSPYSTLLYLSAAGGTGTGLGFESLAFVPQLLLSVVAIPLVLAKKNLPGAMMAQTFAFVTFNKVCTSQVCVLRFPSRYTPNRGASFN